MAKTIDIETVNQAIEDLEKQKGELEEKLKDINSQIQIHKKMKALLEPKK